MVPELIPKKVQHALWLKGIISWMLWPQQMVIYQAIRSLPPSVVLAVILCARQFGKTYLGTLLAIEDCLRYRNSTILIVGPTIKQTKEIIGPKVKEIAYTAPKGLIRQLKSENKWTIGTCDLILGGMDQKITSDRGKSVKQIYIEEVGDSNPDLFVSSTRSDLGPTLTHSKGGRMNFLTTLPPVPDHPFILDTITRAKVSNSFYSYDIDDNAELDDEQKARCAELAGGIDSIEYRREYKNEIIRDKNLVALPSFSIANNVIDMPLPPVAYYHITIDFGGVRDKTAVSLSCYYFLNNIEYFIDELEFEPNTNTDIIMEKVNELQDKWKLVPGDVNTTVYETRMMPRRTIDCAGQTKVDLAAKGEYFANPVKTNWLGNVNNLDNKFRTKEAMIHPRCHYLIANANSGSLNKTKTDFQRTLALGHCDGLAAMMYSVRSTVKTNPGAVHDHTIPTQSQMPALDKINNQRPQLMELAAAFGSKI